MNLISQNSRKKISMPGFYFHRRQKFRKEVLIKNSYFFHGDKKGKIRNEREDDMTFSDELPIRRPMTEDTKKVCEILGIDPDTFDDEVDKAYSAMMAQWHTSSDNLTKEKLVELTKICNKINVHRDHRIKNDSFRRSWTSRLVNCENLPFPGMLES